MKTLANGCQPKVGGKQAPRSAFWVHDRLAQNLHLPPTAACLTQWTPRLDHVAAADLSVYTFDKEPLAANVDVPTSTFDKPLIVVAPAKEAQGTPVSYCLHN